MNRHILLFLYILCSMYNFAQDTMQISQDKAWEIVKEKILCGDTTEVNVYALKSICMAKSQIQTIYRNEVSPDFCSWFFFIDDVPYGDWEHPCRYVFVNIIDGAFVVQNRMRPPLLETMATLVEKQIVLDNKHFIPRVNSINKVNTVKSPNSAVKDYAIIISGGIDKYNNNERYWNHCSYIYSTLINKYGYLKDHINVLMADGTNPAADMKKTDGSFVSSPLDLDGDGVADIQYSATKSNINTVFSNLKQKMSNEDNLFVFVTDHGGYDNGSFMYLWGTETMTPSELNTQLNKINALKINICLLQCHSGGFIPTLQANNRVITTSCASNEVAHSKYPYSFSEFAYHWLSAVSGTTPYGNSVNADSNNDGIISMREAYYYACANDDCQETPQISSNPALLGYYLSLSKETFHGTYYNGTSTKDIILPYPLYTNYGGYVEIKSPNIIGATVTHEGSPSPNYWSCDTTTGYLRTSFPPSSGGTIVVRINRDGEEYVLPIIATYSSNYLSVIVGEGQIEVSLVPGGGFCKSSTSQLTEFIPNLNSSGENQDWTLEVYETMTGKKTFSLVMNGSSYSIATTGWKPGVYIIKAIVNGEVLSKKVIVK